MSYYQQEQLLIYTQMFESLENARFNTCILQKERERLNNHHQQRKVGGAARFSFYICRYEIDMIMSHESLLFFKKTV